MNPPDDRVEAIFHAALELSDRAERDALINAECKDDVALEARVRRLLEVNDDASGLLEGVPLSTRVEEQFARLKPEEAGERIGPYKLLQQIGEGGFGVVWMAEQEQPVRRRVALKIIKMGMDTKEVIGRFEQERQALAMMDHPNIAKVFDAGATQWGRPFFVMELVKGITITTFCDEQQLGTRERLALFGDACSAINHAHQKGIIHRDIKPSNVMVTLHGEKAVVKVIDFGVAKATLGKLTEKTLFTRFEQFIGTPVYMSPEQAATSGLDIDTRSDIYALGILLYELLTGKPPFDAKSLAAAGYEEMRRIIREVEPLKPSSRLSTIAGEERTTLAKARHIEPDKLSRLVEPDLDWIVMKAIEKDRTRRYETANGLALDIQRFLADEPVSATPPSASYKFRKFARRNKTALGVAAAIFAILIVATAVTSWQAIRATHAEDLANKRVVELAAERKDAEAISTFLTEVFQSPDPAIDGREITVVQTLEHAARRLDTDIAQPLQRARLQLTIGGTYIVLGHPREASPLLEKGRDSYLAILGRENPYTLDAIHSLAVAYHKSGRADEALKMMNEVVPLYRKVLGAEDPQTLLAMNTRINCFALTGPADEVLKMREELLALYQKALGAEHNDTLRAAANLASSYADVGRIDEALKLQEETLAICRRVLGPEHLDTLWTMSNLTIYYARTGRGEDAFKMGQDLLPLYRKVLGSAHPTTQGVIGRLADSYMEAGHMEEALPLLAESSTRPFADNFEPLKIAALQAWFGRDADYVTICRRALELAANTDNPSTADRAAKAYCLGPSSDPRLLETALTLARRAVDLGKGKPYFGWYQMALGMAEYRHGDYAAASQTLSDAIRVDKDNEMVRRTAGFFQAMSRFREGRVAEARELFDKAAAAMKPLPADARQPLADGAGPDDLILWLAYKEAKALLQTKAEAGEQ